MSYLRMSFVTLAGLALLMTGVWAQDQTTTATEAPAQQRQAAREAAREAAKEKAAERKAAKASAATTPASTTKAATASTAKGVPAATPAATASPVAPTDSRSAVSAPGIGTFKSGQFTLIAYGCFRTGTRLLCDFDTTRTQSGQIKSVIWPSVHLVDDGGKITTRHNAFFMGDDGSQFNTAYLSPTPVRFIMEYDNVPANVTSISLVNGKDRMQGVPITNATQTTGVPQRGGAAK